MSNHRAPLALALLLNAPFMATLASAQSSTPADEYVVTATRTAQAASAVVRPVQVITAEDIRAAGVSSLTELLRTLGGVEVAANGGLSHASSVFMRGANSEHTVLLVDGVRIGSSTLGTPTFSGIPLSMIERVEVLNGPASSLYGADAIGGVVQVFTRSAQRSPGAEVALTAGSQGLRQATASFAGRFGATEVALGAEWQETGGYNITTPDNTWSYYPDDDGSLRRSVNLRLAQTVAEGQRLSAALLQSRTKSHYDDGPSFDGSAVDTYSLMLTRSASLQWDGEFGPALKTRLAVARGSDESDERSQFPGIFNTRQDQASWLTHWTPVAGQTVSGGAEWRREDVDSDTPYDATRRLTRALVLGWQGQFGAHRVQADWRRDQITGYGAVSTGQLGWSWALAADTRVRAQWGSAFHAPSFNQLYYPGFGNPDLQAERSNSAELGLDTRVAGLDLGVTAFSNRIRDLIGYTPTFALENVAHARIQGLSLTAAGALGSPATRLKLNLTVQDPQNQDTEQPLAARARVFGGAQLTHRIGALRLGTDLTWVGRRYNDNTGAEASHLGGYALLGLNAGWTISPDWALDFKLKNAADRSYLLKGGYATPGREAQLTLRWTPALP